MIKKTIPLLFILFLFIADVVSASHLMGGEITWTCLASGQYKFQMKLYRDCNGIAGPNSVTLCTNAPVGTIPCSLVSQSDNSPVCNVAGPAITCAGATGSTPGAVQEFIYESGPVSLVGVPPATGWVFYWYSSARNMSITNLQNPDSHGLTLRAFMYPYQGRNANPCYDNSPKFYEIPRTIICTGYPFVFNHNAVDNELDSLVYDWDHPLDAMSGGDPPPCTAWSPVNLLFNAGYSYSDPLPGPAQDPRNVAAVLDRLSGEVHYTSYTPGVFVFVIKVAAYKCGTKVAEIFREIQVILNACPNINTGVPNNPPTLFPPFPDPVTGAPHSVYSDTVYAGQNVHFTLNGGDFDFNAAFQAQHIHATASGLEFDPTFSNPNGACLYPPCATLTPSPIGFDTVINYAINFDWNTSCNQLGFNQNCRSFSNAYTFVIKLFDDFCPVPGISTATITVVLLPPPLAAPPSIRCVAVQPNGSVTLSWVPGVDSASSFKCYQIYYSSSATGPFNLIDSVTNYAQTSYNHTGIDANNSLAYYYMKVKSGCDNYVTGNSTDTVQAIKLSAINSGTGIAHLVWNATHTPLIQTNKDFYYIYREYPPGTWTMIDSIDTQTNPTYDDPITICNDTVKYRVEIEDSSGCRSVSSIAGDAFQDLIPPAVPILDSVSVDAMGNAVAGWKADTSLDTHAYVILSVVGGTLTPIDTVYGINNTFFTTSLNANVASIPIRIFAIDSCGNPSSMGNPQSTIFLRGSLDVCSSTITLDWSPYINWPGVLYSIYVSENGGPPYLLDTTSTTEYKHIHLTQNTTYCYFIRANDVTTITNTSTSNLICITAHIIIPPNFSYIHTATITGDNQVTVKAYVDTFAQVTKYKFLRSDSRSGTYSTIGIVSAYPLRTSVEFTDNTAKTDVRSYFYKVVAVDSCGQDAFTSDIARTIFLTVVPNQDISNTVEWNDYEVWLGGVDHYLVYRSIDGVPDGAINTVAFGSGQLIDDVSTKIYSDGVFCYYVESYEGPGDMFGFRDTSRSNQVCVTQSPIVFVPNAFRPGNSSVNNEFNPFKSFVSGASFNLDVYNRWGENVFHNTDPKKGWDGTYKGTLVPDGVYVYFFKVIGTDGTEINKKGSITVIR